MATIILSSYMIRYPVGGVISSNMQFLSGFQRLGHEIVLVESSGWHNACFDPIRRTLTDDPGVGISAVTDALTELDRPVPWVFVELSGRVHGMDRAELDDIFASADLFIDRGLHGTFAEESAGVPLRVLIDPDPGYRQIQMAQRAGHDSDHPDFEAYYTYGHNIGTPRSSTPTAGINWRHIWHPVDVSRVRPGVPGENGPFTTVMNWKSMQPVTYRGRSYGMKDTQFPAFQNLPSRTSASFEVAVEGDAPEIAALQAAGWTISDAVHETRDLASYRSFISRSLAEFSVLKEVYAALDVGWFSDRSALYLAHGRPVIVQDNGLDGLLPLGEGLFSVTDIDEAAAAVEAVRRDPELHARAARRIAETYLDTDVVLGRFLSELGLRSGATVS